MNIEISNTAYLPVNTQVKGVLYNEVSGLWEKRLAYSSQKRKSWSGITSICDGALPCLHEVQLRRKIVSLNELSARILILK